MIQAAGAAKVRDPGFRTDTRAAEKDDVAAAIHQFFQFADILLHNEHTFLISPHHNKGA